MKTLAQRCRNSFSYAIRERGEQYFRKGHVAYVESSETGLKAVVKGTKEHHVSLIWGPPARKQTSITTNCSCEYFAKSEFCKHIWAVILEADSRLFFNKIPGDLPLHVLHGEGLEADEIKGVNWLKKMKSALDAKVELPVTKSKFDNSVYFYTLDMALLKKEKKLSVKFYHASYKIAGEPRVISPVPIYIFSPEVVKDPDDRQALSLIFTLSRAAGRSTYTASSSRQMILGAECVVPALTTLISTGRLFTSEENILKYLTSGEDSSLHLDLGDKFSFELFVNKEADSLRLKGRFQRRQEVIYVSRLDALLEGGHFLYRNILSKFGTNEGAHSWIEGLFENPDKFKVEEKEVPLFLDTVMNGKTPVTLSADLLWPREIVTPKVRAVFQTEREGARKQLVLRLVFSYGFKDHPDHATDQFIIDSEDRKIFEKNFKYEEECLVQMKALGAEGPFGYRGRPSSFNVPANQFMPLAQKCISLGWKTEAEGKKMTFSTNFEMAVTSGIDWFDLHASVDFDGTTVGLPALLAAVKEKSEFVTLGDGTIGVLPQEWVKKYETLSNFGTETDGKTLRFQSNQAILLQAWLETEKSLKTDQLFKDAVKKIRTFDGIGTKKESSTFKGTLRPYQREGLAWFYFLEEFGLGGILADDMGLGKTIQCLAFLEHRRLENKKTARGPNLLIAPKSLVFNWIEEAKIFTPQLKILNYTGKERVLSAEFDTYDLVVTTYQTLRLDIEKFKKIRFDVAVIDEAQAIKNENSQISRATKLIQANFRLAMTGTPIENSLRDLFSISEFVNPGLLGKKGYDNVTGDENALQTLSRGLKPIILRRTKGQVLKELPDKSEQVVTLELPHTQRKHYDELKTFYKNSLDETIEEKGFKNSKIQVLTALLRLRQAALHPGLIDSAHLDSPSAKVSFLIEQLLEVTSEGHKALVFSQFTSFLSIIKTHLKANNIKFQYIDGKTLDRKAAVQDFKDDKSCMVFLLSLKAGGVGLNLTEADYVYILDPWWNPAVEAQAIDRVHRIGQKNKVFAYKFIAKDTVEEKILELQKSKKNLADAVISDDKSLIKNLTPKDLMLLFT